MDIIIKFVDFHIINKEKLPGVFAGLVAALRIVKPLLEEEVEEDLMAIKEVLFSFTEFE